MKTPQNAPFCIKSAKKILGDKPHQTPSPFPRLAACTAKKASYAPVICGYILQGMARSCLTSWFGQVLFCSDVN